MDKRNGFSRRRLLGAAASTAALGSFQSFGAGAAVQRRSSPAAIANAAAANIDRHSDNILVVLELSGGNDGLNTLVPYADDAYYRARPTLGIAENSLLKVDDHFGFNPGAKGLHRLWQSGDLAVVHGCGYPDPSYSHFTSMGYWHTAAPHSGEAYGWMGRLADSLAPMAPANYLLNVGATQSLGDLVSDVAGVEVGEDEHVRMASNGRARRFGRADRGNPCGVELQLAVDGKIGGLGLHERCRAANLVDPRMLGRPFRREAQHRNPSGVTRELFE